MDKKQLLTIITCTVVVVTALCIHDLVKMALTEKPKQSISEEISAEAEPTAKPEAESTEEAGEVPEEISEDIMTVKGELTDEQAEAIIFGINDAMQNIMDDLEDLDGSGPDNREEVRSRIGEYFDETIIDYVLYVYQIEEKNGVYTHRPYAETINYRMIYRGISILSQGDDWCEAGVVFWHTWELMRDEETVPVRLEWKEDRWLVTDMSQWYNDFRYYYRPDETFAPVYFTKEQAEKLVESFGTDEAGNRVRITAEPDEDGYIAAGSSERLLTEDEISGLSRYQRYLAVQEIYARHGKKFSDTVLYGYFRERDWYNPYEFVFSKEQLSEIEMQNISMLSENEGFTWEADIEYGSLYPVVDSQDNMITEEEAAYMVCRAFDMAGEVISFKKENFIEEKSDDVYHVYSLGEYSDEESLKKYLSNWFDESVFDYLVMMNNTWNGLYKGEDGQFTISEGGTYGGAAYYPYFFQKVAIQMEDKDRIVVKVPFYNYGWKYAEENSGEITFDRIEGRWVITSISQPYYDEFYNEFYSEFYNGYYNKIQQR